MYFHLTATTQCVLKCLKWYWFGLFNFPWKNNFPNSTYWFISNSLVLIILINVIYIDLSFSNVNVIVSHFYGEQYKVQTGLILMGTLDQEVPPIMANWTFGHDKCDLLILNRIDLHEVQKLLMVQFVSFIRDFLRSIWFANRKFEPNMSLGWSWWSYQQRCKLCRVAKLLSPFFPVKGTQELNLFCLKIHHKIRREKSFKKLWPSIYDLFMSFSIIKFSISVSEKP